MRTNWAERLGVLTTALMLIAAPALARGDQLLVSNVFATQIQSLAIVFVSYDLETVGDIPATVSLYLSTDGGFSYPHHCQSVSGDVGIGVLPGPSHRIIWNAGLDIPGILSENCRMRVTADDGVEDVYVAPGTFAMGSPMDEPGRDAREAQHQVTLTHGFNILVHEITNLQFVQMAQWAYDHGLAVVTGGRLRDNLDGSTLTLKVLDAESSEVTFANGTFGCINPDHPVTAVMWYGAVAYCDWASLREGLPRAYDHGTWQCNGGSPYGATGYRLPTEAEWEYACRAGTTTAFANGPIAYSDCAPADPNLDMIGWYCGNAGDTSHPMEEMRANLWGLQDMHGNVWEWCNDWYASYGGTVTDPPGQEWGGDRVIRGGNWNSPARNCRSACREFDGPSELSAGWGFRIVKTAN